MKDFSAIHKETNLNPLEMVSLTRKDWFLIPVTGEIYNPHVNRMDTRQQLGHSNPENTTASVESLLSKRNNRRL
jgi:hypothetical protein